MIKLNEKFYDKVVEEIRNSVNDLEDIECSVMTSESCDFNIDLSGGNEAYIAVAMEVRSSWHDESFDHAFGTWTDPAPYWEPYEFEITEIDCADFYDENENPVPNDFDVTKLKGQTFHMW